MLRLGQIHPGRGGIAFCGYSASSGINFFLSGPKKTMSDLNILNIHHSTPLLVAKAGEFFPRLIS